MTSSELPRDRASRPAADPVPGAGRPVAACSTAAALLALLAGCATSGPPLPSTPSPAATPFAERRSARVPEVHVVFRGGQAFAREAGREWPISEVGRDEMLWAPDGQRFAYLKRAAASAPVSSLLGGGAARRPHHGGHRRPALVVAETYRIVIRNLRGDAVNEFSVYRPGRPSELDWVDNQQLAYLAPPDSSGDAYVIHSSTSGEVLHVLRGTGFTWAPGRRHLAYVAGKKEQTVRVGARRVWPRGNAAAAAPPKKGREQPTRRAVVGELVWAADGQGLAFMERTSAKTGNLVVLLVVDDQSGDLVWPLPPGAMESGNRLFWAESRVVIGTSQLKPRFAASWKRER